MNRYNVIPCVCDWAIVDINNDNFLIVVNSRKNADLICDILNYDNTVGYPYWDTKLNLHKDT